jgi:ABC-type multidrug transport system fused ATPase/permease subunit
VRLTAHRPDCGAHTFPYIDSARGDAVVEHEATTTRISGAAVLLPAARHRPQEATALIVGGFCQAVLEELPMEFALEAKALQRCRWKARWAEPQIYKQKLAPALIQQARAAIKIIERTPHDPLPLQVRDLRVDVGERTVLRSSLDVAAGALVVLMGANGSGKSTLGMALAGHPPTAWPRPGSAGRGPTACLARA